MTTETKDEATAALWGGRFQGQLHPIFEGLNQSLPFDRRMALEDVRGSVAWAKAIGAAGVLTAEEVTSIVAALGEIHDLIAGGTSGIETSDAEDVHSFVEAELVKRVGDLGKKLHTGRSRNDQVATDLKLHLRSWAGRLDAAAADLQRALVELAAEHVDTAIPGYTHLQRAQPVTFGHQCLAYAHMLQRDRGRVADAAKRMDACPLGSGALAGAPFALDREALAADLGFSAATRNSLDGVSDRDHALEFVFACTTTMLHLSRLAEDWIFQASQEAGVLRFGDTVSTGSSLMPQKRNPDALELLRGKVGRVHGDLSALVTVTKGLPLAYNKDLQEDKEALFDALDTTVTCLEVAALCARDVEVDVDRARAANAEGFLDATDLADLLCERGVPFRDAHERVGATVERAVADGVTLAGLSDAARTELLPELEGVDLAAALSVDRILSRRDVLGGTAPDQVRAEVAWWQERLAGA